MARHLVPPSTKVKSEIIFGLTFIEIFICLLGLGFSALFLLADLGENIQIIGFLGGLAVTFLLIMKAGNLRGYQFFFYFFTMFFTWFWSQFVSYIISRNVIK